MLSLQGNDTGNAIFRPRDCRSYFPRHGSKGVALDPLEYEFLFVRDPVQDDTYYSLSVSAVLTPREAWLTLR